MNKVTKVTVDRQCLRIGKPKKMCECPLAIALHTALGGSWDVTYHDARCKVTHRIINLTPQLQHFVQQFDNGNEFLEPFSFLVEHLPLNKLVIVE